MIKKLGIGAFVWASASSALIFGKAGSSNDLVFGNYSDYISPTVADQLKEEHGLRIDLFDYDHLVKERFEKGIYDMAIVSTSVLSELKSSGLAAPLDWSQLLNNNSESGSVTNGNKTWKDAEPLFTDIVQNMSKGLLEYGIPYFVQKLSFYYIGEPINELKDNKKVSFEKLVEIVSKEERFKSTDGKHTLGLIDDPRTVLSFARKVARKKDVNPSDTEYSNSDLILDDYKKLIIAGLSKEQLGNNFLFMHSDSGPLVDALSHGTIKGAFMYNGDGFFAANGGNDEKEPEKDKFHTVELSENIFFLDFLAFSSKMSPEKKEKAHKLAKELLFLKDSSKPFRKEGVQDSSGENTCAFGDDEEDEKKEESEESDDTEKEEPEYEETVVKNFNDVWYTPTLKAIYDKLDDSYFCLKKPEASQKIKSKLKSKIIKVEKTEGGNLEQDYERQLNSQQKSDMLIAYSEFKSLL